MSPLHCSITSDVKTKNGGADTEQVSLFGRHVSPDAGVNLKKASAEHEPQNLQERRQPDLLAE
jgi:hypothetical protein